jgi:hypothetical protein
MSSSQAHPSLPDTNAPSLGQHSPPAAKIALFRSLFRGREDVYPRRFESRKTGRSGYAPACANEWVQGICEKPRIKCAVCPHRRFLPVTDDVIGWHLSGAQRMAVSSEERCKSWRIGDRLADPSEVQIGRVCKVPGHHGGLDLYGHQSAGARTARHEHWDTAYRQSAKRTMSSIQIARGFLRESNDVTESY